MTHEALLMGVDLLELAPVPGLLAAARTLLNIWDILQRVDVSLFPLYHMYDDLTRAYGGMNR